MRKEVQNRLHNMSTPSLKHGIEWKMEVKIANVLEAENRLPYSVTLTL
jgi:hypothetical protein